jgi:hypothetical protein
LDFVKEHEQEALGELGLSPKEYGQLTYGEYVSKLKGYYIAETRRAWQIGQFVCVGSGFGDPKHYPSWQMILDSMGGEG